MIKLLVGIVCLVAVQQVSAGTDNKLNARQKRSEDGGTSRAISLQELLAPKLRRQKRATGMTCQLIEERKPEMSERALEIVGGPRLGEKLGSFGRKAVEMFAFADRYMAMSISSAFVGPRAERWMIGANRLGNVLMYITMIPEIIGGLLEHDWKRAAIGAAWIAVPEALGYLSARVMAYAIEAGLPLLATVSALVGVLSGTVFAAFAVVTFCHYASAWYHGTPDMLFPMVMSGVAAGAMVFTTLMSLGAFVGIETCAAIAAAGGPAGAVIAGLAFLSIMIYSMVMAAKHVNDVLGNMSWSESFEVGIHSLFHPTIEHYLQRQAAVKSMENQQLANMRKAMKQDTKNPMCIYLTSSWVRRKLSTSFEVVRETTDYRKVSPDRHVKIGALIRNFNETAITVVEVVEDNAIDFSKRVDRYVRGKPDTNRGEQMVCNHFNMLKMDSDDRWESMYDCKGMLGLEDTTCKNGMVYIDIGNGSDVIKGHQNLSNEVFSGAGFKLITGGVKDDTFIIHSLGSHTYGLVHGYNGSDTLVLNQYLPDQPVIQFVALTKNMAKIVTSGSGHELVLKDVENILGREKMTDRIDVICGFHSVNMRGGTSDSPDVVTIGNRQCNFNTLIAVGGNTHVENKAKHGSFMYEMHQMNSSSALVQLPADFGASSHAFQFDYPVDQLDRIELVKEKATKSRTLHFHTKHAQSNETRFTIEFYHPDHPISFSDDTTVLVNGEDVHLSLPNTTSKTFSETMEHAKQLSLNHRAYVTAGVDGKFIHVGFTPDAGTNLSKTHMNTLTNQPEQQSWLIGGRNNVYNITAVFPDETIPSCTFNDVTIEIRDPLSHNVIDLVTLNTVLTKKHGFKQVNVVPGGQEGALTIYLSVSGTVERESESGELVERSSVIGRIRINLPENVGNATLLRFKLSHDHTRELYTKRQAQDLTDWRKLWIDVDDQSTETARLFLTADEAGDKAGIRRVSKQADKVFFSLFFINSVRMAVCWRQNGDGGDFDCDSVAMLRYFDKPSVYDQFKVHYGPGKSTSTVGKLLDTFCQQHDSFGLCTLVKEARKKQEWVLGA